MMDKSATPFPPWLMTEFLISAALITEMQGRAPLPLILELVDARQHLVMSAEETAAILRTLVNKGLLEIHGEAVTFPGEIWKLLPYTRRGKLDVGRRALRKWQVIVDSSGPSE